jgi:hypothetical protein
MLDMTSFPISSSAYDQTDFRLETALVRADEIAEMNLRDFDEDMGIPEPDPIRHGKAIDVVPYLSLSHGADWKTLKLIKGLFPPSIINDCMDDTSPFDPLPVQSLHGMNSESFSNILVRECMRIVGKGNAETDTVSTATDSMSLNSSNHSFQSSGGESPLTSPSRRKVVDPSRQNFQEKQWEEKFRDLLRFQKKHGHFNVPHDGPNQQVSVGCNE